MGELATILPMTFTLFGVFAGAFVAGFAGFGLAAAAGAFLLHVLPASTAVPLMMLCSVVAQVIGLFFLRKSMDFRGALPFVLSGALAIPVAVTILGTADTAAFKFGFGVFLVTYATYCLATTLFRSPALAAPGSIASVGAVQLQVRPGPVSAAFVGFAGGLIRGLTAMPGAALSIWGGLRAGDKMDRRSVVQPFILAMQLLALIILAWNGRLFKEEIVNLFLISMPPLALGTGLGLVLFGRVNSSTFRVCVLGLVLISGLMMVVD